MIVYTGVFNGENSNAGEDISNDLAVFNVRVLIPVREWRGLGTDRKLSCFTSLSPLALSTHIINDQTKCLVIDALVV